MDPLIFPKQILAFDQNQNILSISTIQKEEELEQKRFGTRIELRFLSSFYHLKLLVSSN